MAYINAEETKIIRDDLKKAFPFVKFSVKNQHHSSVIVTILEAPFNFDFTAPRHSYQGKKYFDVNVYWISPIDEERQQVQRSDEGHTLSLGDHEAYQFLRAVKEVVTKSWWDKSDLQSDYHHTAFYYDIRVGSWEKPFIQTARPANLTFELSKEDRIKDIVDNGNINQETLDAVADKIQAVFEESNDALAEKILAKVEEVTAGRGAPTPSMAPLSDAEFRARFKLVKMA